MQLKIYSTETEFRSLCDDWNALTTDPLHSFDWHFAWWKSLGTGNELRLYVVEENGQVIGIAPFFLDNWLGQKRLRFIGSGDACTDYPQIISTPDKHELVSLAIAEDIQHSKIATMIEFEGVRKGEDVLKYRLPDFEKSYWRYDLELESTWVLPIGMSWNEFVDNSNKSLRRKIRKALKRLDSGQAEVKSTQQGFDFNQAYEALMQLHQKRFVGKGEPGVFSDVRFTQFLKETASSLCEDNRAEILIGYVDDSVVAAQFYLLGEQGPQFYQAGICPDNMKLEPGHLMFTYAIRQAIENNYEVFDFLRGNEPYKPFWGAHRQEIVKTRYVSKSLVPTLVNQSYRTLRTIKRSCSSAVDRLKTSKPQAT